MRMQHPIKRGESTEIERSRRSDVRIGYVSIGQSAMGPTFDVAFIVNRRGTGLLSTSTPPLRTRLCLAPSPPIPLGRFSNTTRYQVPIRSIRQYKVLHAGLVADRCTQATVSASSIVDIPSVTTYLSMKITYFVIFIHAHAVLSRLVTGT